MPRYRIKISFGFVGCEIEDEIEAETLSEANEIAWDMACERVESYAELIDDD